MSKSQLENERTVGERGEGGIHDDHYFYEGTQQSEMRGALATQKVFSNDLPSNVVTTEKTHP